jgi:hypothetical protein
MIGNKYVAGSGVGHVATKPKTTPLSTPVPSSKAPGPTSKAPISSPPPSKGPGPNPNFGKMIKR